jgi:lipopolysaccharide biosynthesis protein
MKTNRMVIYHHFDRNDVVDNYVIHTLSSLRSVSESIHFVTNSNIDKSSTCSVEMFVDTVTTRPNRGYDFAGWKQVILHLGRKRLEAFDEVIFVNSSVYGPLFDLSEMLDEMAGRACDFWTPTSHTNYAGIPYHLQPYFLVVRRRLHQADAFWSFWESVREDYDDLWDVVWNSEIRLTQDWTSAGFVADAYVSNAAVGDIRPIGLYEPFVLHAADDFIARQRMPFVKVKAFYKAEYRPTGVARQILQALDAAGSRYPRSLILNHQRRVSPLSWQKNLPGTLVPISGENPVGTTQLRIGVFAHFFYIDLFHVAIDYLRNIPYRFDLYVTTCDADAASGFESMARSAGLNLGDCIVKVVPNRGRDIAPWLIEFRKEHLSYDLALKLHLKKHSHYPEIFGAKWNRYIYEALLNSAGHVARVVAMFEADPMIGHAFPPYPPLYVLMFPQGFYGSPEDRQHRQGVLDALDIAPPAEPCQPVFSAGGMGWYRPQAVRRLLEWPIGYDDFPAEPHPLSGTISHGLERVIPYVSQADGYSYRLLVSAQQLEEGYEIYEDRLMSTYDQRRSSVGEACLDLIVSIRQAYHRRFPVSARKLIPLEQKIYKKLRRLLAQPAL